MSSDLALESIKSHLAQICGIEASSIEGPRPLVEYGLDSVRAMDLIIALEEEFQIIIEDDEVSGLRTLDDIMGFVGKKRDEASG